MAPSARQHDFIVLIYKVILEYVGVNEAVDINVPAVGVVVVVTVAVVFVVVVIAGSRIVLVVVVVEVMVVIVIVLSCCGKWKNDLRRCVSVVARGRLDNIFCFENN